ncbi:Uncharacterized protein involved in synaptonemal complex formation [Ceraceosorus bombacis]|uniref:Uncharacterized protein involved in synaptonemal complex formation n=1 Tax=Ceraceosorus bombacis TaxID=401625 RepID=A0A0P1BHV2_9BASI|nr:Uncharacterized protein involved in synaptonemal complex formation [Ceraceosorus bombacis]
MASSTSRNTQLPSAAIFQRHIHCGRCMRPRDEAVDAHVPLSQQGSRSVPTQGSTSRPASSRLNTAVSITAPTEPLLSKEPFWLTQCAHIICGNCQFPNGTPVQPHERTHTCALCQTSRISISLLTDTNLPPAVAPYFRQVSTILEEVAEVHLFQATHMGSLIDYLRKKVLAQRQVLERVKLELEISRERKRRIEELEYDVAELQALLQQHGHRFEAQVDRIEEPAQPTAHTIPPMTPNSFAFQTHSSKRRRSSSPPSKISGAQAGPSFASSPQSASQHLHTLTPQRPTQRSESGAAKLRRFAHTSSSSRPPSGTVASHGPALFQGANSSSLPMGPPRFSRKEFAEQFEQDSSRDAQYQANTALAAAGSSTPAHHGTPRHLRRNHLEEHSARPSISRPSPLSGDISAGTFASAERETVGHSRPSTPSHRPSNASGHLLTPRSSANSNRAPFIPKSSFR